MWLWILAVLLLPLFWVSVDALAGVRSRKFLNAGLANEECEDFNVLIPIYGNAKYLQNYDYLSQYGSRVILCTTSGETEIFYKELRAIAGRYGFQIYRSPYAPVTTSKKRRTGGVIRDRVIRDALNNVCGLRRFVVCMDADTSAPEPLEKLVGALAASEADFASIDLVPQADGGALVQLQRHEYRQSMRLRFLVPWMLSGACHVGKTEVFRNIMSRHSLFFQGNDVEAGLLGDQLGYRAIHLPFKVDTEVPSRFLPWWRQRIAWAGGEFRLFITNFRFILKHPFLWTYGGIMAISLVGARWLFIINPAWVIIMVAVLYYVLVVFVHWENRNRWLLLLPLYTLFHSMILTLIGIIWYFIMAIPERNFGVIRPKGPKKGVEVLA